MISAARRADARARGAVATPSASSFLAAFRLLLISDPHLAENLRGAAHGVVLRPWTELLTSSVARTCNELGWDAAAKGIAQSPLPFPRFEYLGLDVTAFEPGSEWRPAIAAFELENGKDFVRIAYALWKVASVRTCLAGLFCFRRDADEIAGLIGRLTKEVLSRFSQVPEELIVVVGTRADAETFPDGYFRAFRWEKSLSRFVVAGLSEGAKRG